MPASLTRGALLFLVVAAVGAAALVPGAFLRGEVLSQSQLLYSYPPWNASAPVEPRRVNPVLSDAALVFYPFLTHTVETVRRGEFPVWNAAIYAGHPFFASMQTAVLSPFTAIAYVVPLPRATVFMALAPLVVGALGMFVFVRQLGLNVPACWFAGLAYLLNAFGVAWMEHPLGAVSCWVPWILYATDALLKRPDTTRVAALAIVVALTFLSGHPETAIKALLLGGAYAVAMSLAESPTRTRVAAIAYAAGALVAAIQLVPFLEYLMESEAFAARALRSTNQWFAPVSALAAGLVPDFFGNPANGGYLVRSNRYGVPSNYVEQALYPGMMVILLAPFGLFARPREWRVRFFAVVVFASCALMFGLPGVLQAVSSLPLVGVMVLSRFGLVAIAASIVLAAYAVDALTSEADVPRWARWAAAFAPAIVIAAIAVAYAASFDLLEAHGLARSTLAACATGVAFGLAGAAITVLRVRRTISPASFGIASAILLTADLVMAWHGFHPTTQPDRVYPHVTEIERVRRDPGVFRVYGWGDALVTNTGIPYGLHDARGWDGMNPYRYTRLLDLGYLRQHASPEQHLARPTLLDVLNVKYVFVDPGIRLTAPRYRQIGTEDAPVYENTRAFPRAFLVHAYRVLDERALMQALHDGREDLSQVVLLEHDLPIDERPRQPSDGDGPADSVRIIHYRDTYVELEVESSARALLVISDAYYPGWTASVDQEPVPIRRANYALRAISVPAGRHAVRFEYHPRSFRIGALLSAATLLALAASVLRQARRT